MYIVCCQLPVYYNALPVCALSGLTNCNILSSRRATFIVLKFNASWQLQLQIYFERIFIFHKIALILFKYALKVINDLELHYI